MSAPAVVAPSHAELQKAAEENAQVAERVLLDLRSRPVVDAAGYTLAAEELKEIKGEFKRIDDIRRSAVEPLKAVVKLIDGWFKKPLDTLAQAEALRKNEMAGFLQRQRDEHQKAIEEASAAALAGDQSAAAAALMRVEPTAPKVAGVRQTTTHKARVTDFAAFVQAAAANPMLLGCLQVNESALNAIARTTKGTAQIPGIEFYAETGIASTSGNAGRGGAK